MNPESLDSVLAKKDSLTYVWALLNPKPEYHNLYNQFMREWNRRSHRQQQQFYWFVREKIRKHQVVHDNPLYALCYIHPHPTNWNGKQGINSMMNSTKMVTAFYDGSYGTYTLLEATIFEMTHVKPLNF